MNLEAKLKEGEQVLARIWKAMALRGLAGIAFGVIALAWPGIGLTALIALVGAFALVAGVTTVIGAFEAPIGRSRRAWLVVDGLLGVAVAVVVLAWPGLSAHALLYAIAAWAIAAGALEVLLGAFFLPLSGGRALLLMLLGLVSAAFGGIMFAHPGAGALALLALIAAYAIVTGVVQLAYAVELRRVAAELRRRLEPRATARPLTHG
ncbi:MAG TPA: DUF308 domain-containing protein [Gaiellaceae bacterium]|nr:DUF308 domain-containing protein [Gaiellaceae bacterium]